MTVEIISLSISTKVWDRAGIELETPGIAVRHASVARHVTDCATRPGNFLDVYISQRFRFARVCSNVDDFNNRNLLLTAKLLKTRL